MGDLRRSEVGWVSGGSLGRARWPGVGEVGDVRAGVACVTVGCVRCCRKDVVRCVKWLGLVRVCGGDVY